MHSQQQSMFCKVVSDGALRAAQPQYHEEFEVISSTVHDACPILEGTWKRMLESGRSAEKMFQTPAFVRYMKKTHLQEGSWEVVIVRRRSDAGIVGILPIRKSEEEIRLQLGPICLFKRGIEVLQVLGSVPLLNPKETGLLGFVFKNLLHRHPDCRALVMQATPMEMIGEFQGIKGMSSSVLHGWRDCHTVPLPQNVDDYLGKFSSKKRYNLSRQVRLLAKEAGEVRLVRITQPAQVPDLVAAISAIPDAKKHMKPNLQGRLESLAENGLLLSYLLQCGAETVALILGSCGEQVWHVHNIHCDEKYSDLSVGTSITHLALQDLINNLSFKVADFGYGTPNQEYRSTHVLEKRGKLLLCRTHSLANLMLKVCVMFDFINESLSERIKLLKRNYRQYRRQARGIAATGTQT